MLSSPITRICVMMVLAALPKAVMAFNTPVISIDGVGYIEASRGGEEAAAGARLPLYPFLIRQAGRIIEDPVWAGKAINVLCGTLFPFLMYGLSRVLGIKKSALAVFLLAAFQPYLIRFSGDVLSEPLFMCFMAACFLFTVKAAKHPFYSLLSGASAAGACLVRPEGFALLFLGFLGYFFFAIKKRWIPSTLHLACGLVLLLPAFMCGVYERGAKSTLGKTYFESLASMEKTSPMENPPPLLDFMLKEPSRVLKKSAKGLVIGLEKLIQVLHPLVFLFFLLGVWFFLKGEFAPGPGAAVVLPSLFLFLFFCAIYPSKRYMLQVAIPFLLFAGWAMENKKWMVISLVLICALCQAKAGFSQRKDKLHILECAQRIQGESGLKRPILITGSVRCAFYAQGDRTDPKLVDTREKLKALLDQYKGRPVFYVAEPSHPIPKEGFSELGVRVVEPGS